MYSCRRSQVTESCASSGQALERMISQLSFRREANLKVKAWCECKRVMSFETVITIQVLDKISWGVNHCLLRKSDSFS